VIADGVSLYCAWACLSSLLDSLRLWQFHRHICRHLGPASANTIKNYLFRIFNKLGVSSRVEVVIYADQNNRGKTTSGECFTPKLSDIG
jgi:hypothetical protein